MQVWVKRLRSKAPRVPGKPQAQREPSLVALRLQQAVRQRLQVSSVQLLDLGLVQATAPSWQQEGLPQAGAF